MGFAGASGPDSCSTRTQGELGCLRVASPGFSVSFTNASNSVMTAIDSCKFRHSMWVAERAIGLTIVGIFAEQLNYFLIPGNLQPQRRAVKSTCRRCNGSVWERSL